MDRQEGISRREALEWESRLANNDHRCPLVSGTRGLLIHKAFVAFGAQVFVSVVERRTELLVGWCLEKWPGAFCVCKTTANETLIRRSCSTADHIKARVQD